MKYKKFKDPIILIASEQLIKLQMKKLNFKRKIRLINFSNLKKNNLDNLKINLINVNFDQTKPFDIITDKSNDYIEKSFDIALKILNKKLQINL